MKTTTKEAAEAALRELPSVLGAFVNEDINGHPREVHLLVRPGPNARDLSRDIKDLLEDRLGVAIDQRVISIAQISATANVGGADGDGRTDRQDGAGPTDAIAAVVRATANAAHNPALDRDPERPGWQRVSYEGLEAQRRDGEIEISVTVSRDDATFVGTATDVDAGSGELRAAAIATVEAVTDACAGAVRFEMESCAVIRAAERDYAHISVLAISPSIGRRPLPLAGAHPLADNPPLAATMAVMKATNRTVARILTDTDEAD